jgi:hypothetical protein
MTESSIKCGSQDKPSKTEYLRPQDWERLITVCPDSDTKRVGHCKNPQCNPTHGK